MTKVLILGSAGFIGSNLTKRLLEQEGCVVDAVDDLSNGHMEFINPLIEKYNIQIKFFEMDFTDEVILSKIRNKEYDVIYHQAAIPRVGYSVDHPSITTDTNINKTVKLLEAARGNIRRFVFASSSSVYGGAENLPTLETEPLNPVSPYALQKKVIEDFGKMFYKLYDLDVVCLRYFNVFGPNQYGDSPYSTAVSAWCHAVKNGLPLRSDGDGEQTRDLCYIDNVIDANILVANCEKRFKGQVFNVACGERTSNNQILEYFKKKFKNIEIVNAPRRKGDVKHTLADITSIVELGYKPSVKFWKGLEKTTKWWGI